MSARDIGRTRPDNVRYGPDNPHPLSTLRTELVWEGKYDEYGNRREVDTAGLAMPLPKTPTAVARQRRASVTPRSGLTEGQAVTVAWQHYAPGVTINVLQCSRNPPTGPGECALHSARLVQPDPQGTGALTFLVHAGPVGSGICDAAYPGCVIGVNEGGSLDPKASVFVPITFASGGVLAPPTTQARTAAVAHIFCLSAPLVGRIGYTPAQETGTANASPGQVVGDVGGFPPDIYILGHWLDTTITPAKTITEISFRTDSTGTQHLSGPSFIAASDRITKVVFRVGTSDRDARPYGPTAYPCAA